MAAQYDAHIELTDREVFVLRHLREQLERRMAADGVLDLRQRTIERIFRQVDLPEHLTEQLQSDLGMHQRLQLLELVVGLLARFADKRHKTRHDLDVIFRAAEFWQAILQRAIEFLRVVKRLAGREYDVGDFRRQFLPHLRRSRLDHYRTALRRTRHIERAAHGKMFALVVELMNLVGMKEAPLLLVAHEGVLVP